MRRFIVHDRQGNLLFDLDGRVKSAERTEKLNGEHGLTITTTQPLEEGLRILVRDGTLKWREWVIDEPDESHTTAGMEGTYGCTWSMQYDLATVDGGELWPGTYSPIAAGAALAMVLATQSTWEVGNVSVAGLAGTSLFDGQVWDYLGQLLEVWGGEMEPRIEVDSNGVTHRYVDWSAHVGNTEPTRRFDFGEDCTSIRRKVATGPRYCRIVPRGGKDAQDADGVRYSDRCGVEEEPRRVDGDFVHDANSKYVRDTVAEQLFRTKDRHGNWHYPEKVVCYDLDLDGDQEELLNKAMEDVENHTRPKVTYEADVLQFAAAGMDAHGVQLGDEVQIVDKAFGDAALRLQARVVEMTVNELDDTDIKLTIGDALMNMDAAFKSMYSAIDGTTGRVRAIEAGGTIVYLKTLIDQLNSEINATGGYVYVTDGDGLLTYDRAVSDPTVGAEATKVVEIKGGSIRIANSRTSGGDWNWKTVFVSGHILAELVTAAHLTAGYIGSASSGNYWNLDTGEFRMAAASTKVGNQTLAQYIGDNLGLTQTEVFNLLTNNGALQGLYMSGGQLYMNATYIKTGALNADLITTGSLNAGLIKTGYLGDASGKSYWDLSNGTIVIVNSTKNFNNRNEQFKFGTVTFTERSGWLNTRTAQQSATGIMMGDVSDALVSGRSRVFIIPNLPATSSDSDTRTETVMIARNALKIMSFIDGTTTSGCLSLNSGLVEINQVYGGTVKPGIILSNSSLYLYATRSDYTTNNGHTVSATDCALQLTSTGAWFNVDTVCREGFQVAGNKSVLIGASGNYTDVNIYGNTTSWGSLSVYGTKNRVVEIDSYGDRLLYCYETPAPLFGDVGSGVIGEDGVCVVEIDDMFSECARTDMAYQVFLQKCGQGDLWVSEKAPGYFVVEGTPGLPFDWEAKAHQTGYESERLEDKEQRDELNSIGRENKDLLDLYDEELNYIKEIESLYEEAA